MTGRQPPPSRDRVYYHILGLGRFGRLAARRLAGRGELILVDREEATADLVVDGAVYLADLVAREMEGRHWIVPTLPLHLAAVALSLALPARILPWQGEPPWPGAVAGPGGDLLTSLAPGRCPGDCLGPEEACSHDTRDRSRHLARELAASTPDGRPHLVLESRQLAPGVGGYPLTHLAGVRRQILGLAADEVILSTASACHGITSRLRRAPGPGTEPAPA